MQHFCSYSLKCGDFIACDRGCICVYAYINLILMVFFPFSSNCSSTLLFDSIVNSSPFYYTLFFIIIIKFIMDIYCLYWLCWPGDSFRLSRLFVLNCFNDCRAAHIFVLNGVLRIGHHFPSLADPIAFNFLDWLGRYRPPSNFIIWTFFIFVAWMLPLISLSCV